MRLRGLLKEYMFTFNYCVFIQEVGAAVSDCSGSIIPSKHVDVRISEFQFPFKYGTITELSTSELLPSTQY